jgi:branched-chain amino acid aminotransferase
MSVKQLAGDMGITVEARDIPVEELFDFTETGCCGTAAIITPVEAISFRNELIRYLEPGEVCGPVSRKLYDQLTGIQCGDIEDKYGWVREIDLD